MLHKINTDAAYRIVSSICKDFSKGAESFNKNLLDITCRLDDMEQQNKQQHQMTQLQLTGLMTSMTTMTNSVASLDNRVSKTQNAILAQSREVGLTQNLNDNAVNMLTVQMQIQLEKNPTKKIALEQLLVAMQQQGAYLVTTIQSATDNFQAIISQRPINLITHTDTPEDLDPVQVPMVPLPLQKRPSKTHLSTPPGILPLQQPQVPMPSPMEQMEQDVMPENVTMKRRRLNTNTEVNIDDKLEPGHYVSDHEIMETPVSCNGHRNPNRIVMAHDGISVSMMNVL